MVERENGDSQLAPWAMRDCHSRGRRHTEPRHPFRTLYQRDRERIVHSTAFRRMVGKTQVLVGRINDHHRTRLTHTLEVAQISRTIARRLRLNEDLVEAIALSHDIGHPPFGHAGEEALNLCLSGHGGFDHNLYGLRRVDRLEDRYPDFPGLNLSWEIREAFVQHAKHHDPELDEYLEAGGPLLEAQVADAADSLAYDAHDVDDALGIGLITLHDLREVPLWQQLAEDVERQYPRLPAESFRRAVIRELISRQVMDLIGETERRLAEAKVQSVEDVRARQTSLAAFSSELSGLKRELEMFLRRRVYRHHRVLRMAQKGQRILRDLFHEFVNQPHLLPEQHLLRWEGAAPRSPSSVALGAPTTREASLERVVGDYLAGMTDRFACLEHERLFRSDADS